MYAGASAAHKTGVVKGSRWIVVCKQDFPIVGGTSAYPFVRRGPCRFLGSFAFLWLSILRQDDRAIL